MQLFENIGMALTSVRSNKMRSLLTMLGIIIGIAAVIAIETVGNSMTGSVWTRCPAWVPVTFLSR